MNAAGGRGSSPKLGEKAPSVRHHQLRQRRHGRPQRLDRGGGRRRRGRGPRLAEVVGAVHYRGGACIVTADHGNAEQMLEPDGSPNTAHSLNPVPVIVTAAGLELRKEGILADVAPTAGPAGHRAAGGDDREEPPDKARPDALSLRLPVRADPDRLGFEIAPATAPPGAGSSRPPTADRTPAFIPLATKATVRGV